MTLPGTLPHALDRTVLIEAEPETVFRFFTDSARWAMWWGAGSTIDARPGGQLRIRYPGGVEATGEVIEVDAPRRLVFTYGYVSGKPIPPGASLVTIRLSTERDDWVARAADDTERGRGTNVFVFANGKIESVTGFWATSTPRSAS
jgi:uncharacterized protein YndB with AHSA1/START domain